ncbi:hypothetical protein A2989_02960 [Candidatus Amesbacteria bacterium RIFCSPLOWO2_01_FULL_48_25]|uniref:Carbohydrate-binding module family 96 domain-containing protein n=1 Tax=Candidatus Amesbacteria bacterium RIFCSPLOWO2_01_FULL_48_25 TaxID=1797259 RepID=A0A1F4ZCG1_9BACT|nr:MAG: hypothetical protein A2989_02960 [Candidatus Amesbacteria bacterium RIFCSPLOWO2_01_FULL_48_25]
MPNNRRGLFIILLLLLGLFLGLTAVRQTQLFKKKAALADTATLTFAPLSPTTYSPGNSFPVTVRLNTNTQSISGSDILTSFNADQLSLTGITINPTGDTNLNSTSATFAPVTSTGTFDLLRVINCANNGGSSGCPSGRGVAEFGFVRFNWGANAPTAAYSTNGSTVDVATFTFQVKSTAPAGTNPIKFVFTSLSSTTDSNVTAATTVEDILAAPTSQLNITISSTAPTPTPTLPPGGTFTLTAIEDTYVDSGSPSSNYGSSGVLGVDASPTTKISFLKFDLRNLSNTTITSAKLRLTVSQATNSDSTSTQSVKFISNSSWSESTLTYSNSTSYPLGTVLATNPGGTLGETKLIDITSSVSANRGNYYSVGLDQTDIDGLDIYSSEATCPTAIPSCRPALVISTSSTSFPPGDADHDGDVDLGDLGLWARDYGLSISPANFNSDSTVNGLDYLIWRTNFLPAPSPPTTPTPTTTGPTPTRTPTPTPTPSGPTPTPPPVGSVYRSHTNDSYWNVPMPANAPIDIHSSTYITDSQTSSENLDYLGLTAAPDALQDFGYPIYWATASDPTYNYNYTYIDPVTNNPVTVTIPYRIPLGAKPASGSDGALIVYDRGWNQVIEMWKAVYNSTSNSWSYASFKHYVLDSNGLAFGVTGYTTVLNFGHRGIPPPARAIRVDEVQAGAINHRLECFWWATGTNYANHYWPMSGDEGAKGGIVPEGIVARIKPSVNLSTKGLTPPALVIARALQTYGCTVGDNTGAGNRVQLELNKTAWQNLGLTFSALSSIPWSDYEFIQGGYDPVTGTIRQ